MQSRISSKTKENNHHNLFNYQKYLNNKMASLQTIMKLLNKIKDIMKIKIGILSLYSYSDDEVDQKSVYVL